jgi:predicted metalloprotease
MGWKSGRRSRNVEDRRGRRIYRKATGGGIGIVVIALIAMYFGIDPTMTINQQAPTSVSTSSYSISHSDTADNDQLADFVSVVMLHRTLLPTAVLSNGYAGLNKALRLVALPNAIRSKPRNCSFMI